MATDWDRLTGEMVKGTQALIAKRAEPIEARLAAFEARLSGVETKAARYCGVWQRALGYARGDLATHEGSLWSCISDSTTEEPGTSKAWQLGAKGGAR